jgi:hypothetical protein
VGALARARARSRARADNHEALEPRPLSSVSAANETTMGINALRDGNRAMNSKNYPTGELNQQELELQFQRLVVRRTYASAIDPTKIVDGWPKRRPATTTCERSLKDAA